MRPRRLREAQVKPVFGQSTQIDISHDVNVYRAVNSLAENIDKGLGYVDYVIFARRVSPSTRRTA